MQTFPTIYKKDSKGKLREWRMEVDGDQYRTVSGLADGQQVTSAWKKAKPKNIGKVNATTGEEQAIAEVEALYTKRLTREYHERVEDIDIKRFFKPMLATKWQDRLSKVKYSEGVYTQPKLDGVRCLAKITKDGLFSREGKKFVSVPHISKELETFFQQNPDAVLDGELYNHNLKDDFDEIISLVKKTKPTAEDLIASEKMVEYHVYDYPSLGTCKFSDRYKALLDLFALHNFNSIVLVDTKEVSSEAEVNVQHEKYLEAGYEGTMIRLDQPYQQKRSNFLMKYKEFEDKEFEIIAIEEGQGNWAGYAKRVIFRLEDGRTCGAGLKGNQAFCRQLLKEADQYVGKQATIKYFKRTPDGMPRFPVAKALYKEQRDL